MSTGGDSYYSASSPSRYEDPQLGYNHGRHREQHDVDEYAAASDDYGSGASSNYQYQQPQQPRWSERPSAVIARGGSPATNRRAPVAYAPSLVSSRYDGMRSPFRVTGGGDLN